MDSCHLSWGVSLAPGRPPDLPLGTWRPLGTLCAVLGLGNSPYLSSSPAPGPTGQVLLLETLSKRPALGKWAFTVC